MTAASSAQCAPPCKLRDGEIGACRVRGCLDRLIVPIAKPGRGPLRVEPIEAKGSPTSCRARPCFQPAIRDQLAARFQVNGTQDGMPGAALLTSAGPPREIARCAREEGCPSVVFDGGEPAWLTALGR
jgi:hypothetical protein